MDDERTSHEVPRRTRFAYRLLALPFAAGTVFLGGIFVGALAVRTFRSGIAFLLPILALCAVGLWMVRPWGRSIALVIAVGLAGLGGLSLVAAIVAEAPVVGPAVLCAVSVAVAYLLSRPVFTLPSEEEG